MDVLNETQLAFSFFGALGVIPCDVEVAALTHVGLNFVGMPPMTLTAKVETRSGSETIRLCRSQCRRKRAGDPGREGVNPEKVRR